MAKVEVTKQITGVALRLNKDEATLIYTLVGAVKGDGYWREVSNQIYYALDELGEFCTLDADRQSVSCDDFEEVSE